MISYLFAMGAFLLLSLNPVDPPPVNNPYRFHDVVYPNKWPQTIEGTSGTWIGAVSPVAADLDHDGKKELVVTVQGNSEGSLSTLCIFEFNGEVRSNVGIDYYIDPMAFPTIADIDTDDDLEIVVEGTHPLGLDHRIMIFDPNGNLEKSFEIDYQMSDDFFSAVVAADVSGDDTPELIYGGWGSPGPQLVVLDSDGNTLPGFPVILENTNQAQTNTPAVGDLDGDSVREIVTISHKNNLPADTTNIRAFKSDGSLLWSNRIYANSSCDPVIGDVNRDGYNEVVFSSESGVHILDRYGDFLLDLNLLQDMMHSNIALADLDGDRDLEIIFGYQLSWNAIHHDGTPIFSVPSEGVVRNPPIAGDLDGDGTPDIVFNSDDDVYAFGAGGDILDGFPIPMEPISFSAPSMDDLAGDGEIDLISSSNWIWPTIAIGIVYVWDLDAVYDPSGIHWPMYQHDPQHTGNYSFVP